MKRLLLVLCYITLLAGCQKVVVEQEKTTPPLKPTQLIVGTLYGPQIYFTSGQGDSGYDYEMAERFANYLDLELKMKPFANISELYSAMHSGEIDIIAAGLADTPARREQFRLGPPLYRVNQVLVYRQGTPIPRSVDTLKGEITVTTDSSFVDTLTELQKSNPDLVWNQEKDKDAEELLTMIAAGEIPYTIADSTSLDINRRFMPELREGLVLKRKQPVVWLLPPTNSDKLMSELLSFWHIEKRSGTLAHLNEKYFAHVERFDYVDTRAFIRAIDNKLPKYQATFEKYAEGIDWRKLAATAYQESHWNPNARSPTGVRGLMMLTLPTAKQVGIKNRLDPYQSIKGGAKYLNSMLERLPDSIPESQRMWFALASYNIGLGHVEDARKLAQSQGLNPSAWRDVKSVLPLLQKRKYYQKTRYGYARGNEAVHYVDSIRRYYDTLVWIDNQNMLLELKQKPLQTAEAKETEEKPQTDAIQPQQP
ncbi:membrane-bound lytic murein transglycosylase MltF [Shewanella pealeana]|uniref:Membrane-bound lytic murein transglycosylase F n=1 Tax=Shewanella pealeana (strain ATCC 700345 / ANG-SQ1) TaxID=398579 RepID=MLTF_SHEPA|nr:membrane-bound lytic murein transglycosylase MltF [Shewanella pealeana]A8H256.1 RecName: Full=Membrane-bound lytic murein transglycosylase F; AltName: Full=Murein lyase F; Flags: Precursor [Shewanella pealeana ATCC 700345]ABV86643.1 Lytic transglycosylase catalytic [Shewanella pealeana ATCC 700345]